MLWLCGPQNLKYVAVRLERIHHIVYNILCLYRSLTRQFAGLAVAAPVTRGSRTIVNRSIMTSSAIPSASIKVSPLLDISPLSMIQMQTRSMGTKYKLKSKSAVKKRFKVNCNGLVKRSQANKRHIATKKTRERIRRLGKPVFVEGKIRKNVLKMLRGH